jgi:heme/copper-type cytochrome/quinol oxidase subunit 2
MEFSNSFLPNINNVIISYKNTDVECFKKIAFIVERREAMKHLGLEMFIDNLEGRSEPKWESPLPDVKLYYPEPFAATPSFNHEEIWFIHILHYNYWLLFFFISLIMFYFITFINVVRWCNLRSKPKRETRGVSRSKCADLITACVPVSWAISIIISETVDATDYYDGFGTGEIVIGIRAYQWGWEYFYPKSIDLSYNVRPSYSSMVGNSIKYNNSSKTNLEAAILWKYYQKKSNTSQLNTPSHILLSPVSSTKSLNNIDFSSVANSVSKDTSAFKKVQSISKMTDINTSSDISSFNSIFRKVNNLYLTQSNLNNTSHFYGTLGNMSLYQIIA